MACCVVLESKSWKKTFWRVSESLNLHVSFCGWSNATHWFPCLKSDLSETFRFLIPRSLSFIATIWEHRGTAELAVRLCWLPLVEVKVHCWNITLAHHKLQKVKIHFRQGDSAESCQKHKSTLLICKVIKHGRLEATGFYDSLKCSLGTLDEFYTWCGYQNFIMEKQNRK